MQWWLLRYFQVQLFLSLAALPFIAAHGLPFSPLAFVGNLIFNPIISLFLVVSSLYFFSILLHIPNGLITYALEKITAGMLWCLSWGSNKWLISLPLPQSPIAQWMIFIILFITPLLIIQWIRSLRSALITNAFLLFVSIAGLYFLQPNTSDLLIELTTKKHILIKQSKTASGKHYFQFFDNDTFNSPRATNSWIAFTLIPTLRTQRGIACLNSVIIENTTGQSFRALTFLLQRIHIKRIFMPYFEPFEKKRDWRAYFEFKRAVKEHNVKVIRYKKINNSTETTPSDFNQN